MILYPHQLSTLAELRSRLMAGSRRIMLQLPTGGGKTRCAARIIQSALNQGKRALFTVPAIELVHQTEREFAKLGIVDVGIIQASHPTEWSQPVQIASIQTLQNPKRVIPEADVILVDEAHLKFKFYNRLFNDPTRLDTPIVGLSATPWSRGLGALYTDLIVGATTQELIDAERLSPFKVFAPSSPDLTGVRTRAGDFAEDDLGRVMNDSKLVADVVDTWLRRGDGQPTLCFAVNRTHAKSLEAQFRDAGVTTAYIDGYTKDEERQEIRKAFSSGDVSIIVNVGVMTTGVDLDVRTIILARPTKSEILYTQIIGRGLRPAEGKSHLTILDHSDTTLRLGMVTDIKHDWLDDGKTRGPTLVREKDVLPVKCLNCTFLKPPKTPICPSCGVKAEPKNRVVCDDGELFELTSGRPITKSGRKREFSARERWDIFGQLRWHVQRKGWKPGAAKMLFREMTGIYPDGVESAPAAPPQHLVSNWILSRNIRFANAMRKHRNG